MQSVGDFDKDYSYIIGECEQYLAEILGLSRCVGVKNARHFG